MVNTIYLCEVNDLKTNNFLNKWIDELKDEIIIFRDSTNNVRIFSSVCPHFGGPIVFDKQIHQLKCKWHDWRFCVNTGECLTFPKIPVLMKYDFKVEPNNLNNYEHLVKNNKIYLITQ